MAGKVRVGFIGSGGMAVAHTGAMESIRDAQIAAFCDVVPERAQALGEKYDAPVFADAGKMMDEVALDCVYVLLPPFAHGAAEQAVIDRKIPFFVEKPINVNLKQANQIAEAVAGANLMTCAGYMNRYRKGVNAAKKLLAKDPAVLVIGGWIGGSPNPNPEVPITMWWVQKDKSGGQFLEQVTHTVDLVRYLCGDAVQVSAAAATGFNPPVPGCDIDDATAVTVKFASGAVANLYSCCASNAKGGVDLRVFANQCAFTMDGWGHDTVIHRRGKEDETIAGEGNIFEIEDRAFLKAVRTGDPKGIKSSYEDAVKTLEISVAANKSTATGRTIKLASAA